MKYITLICAGGLSTSLLVNKMKAAAEKQNVKVQIVAMASHALANYKEPTDILLLGPQIAYLEDDIRKTYEPKGIKVKVIDMMDYGMMNGDKVLMEALSLV